ncbi:auxin-responsive protein SAUR66-like [Mercurialis annua]|uniref:auxin-responsive protein SAUR66-like n=1 Tax=Mercurialis annua TaxID=3986 RepID=UPI00215E7F8F|nr:auxin-responsive protein SAUR66-like [Mercurialis annua]
MVLLCMFMFAGGFRYTLMMSKQRMAEVYSADQNRFLLPLEYLNNEIIRELFDMAEDVFGLPSNGRLRYHNGAREVEQSLLISIASSCSLSLHQSTINQLPICSF